MTNSEIYKLSGSAPKEKQKIDLPSPSFLSHCTEGRILAGWAEQKLPQRAALEKQCLSSLLK